MSDTVLTRGMRWFKALAGDTSTAAPVWSGEASLGNETATFFSVVPDPDNRFPRARDNVVGLEQGWKLAQAVREAVARDASSEHKRPIVAIVDVKSQA